MPAASSLLPWFAPRLSRPMIGVLNNLGHEMHYTRGEVLYESPGFFRPLMLVRRGIVARALMDPLHADPLLVSLSGPRALCGSCETLYVQDRMVRRHWCMTSVDVHVVTLKSSKAPTNYFTPNILRKSWSRLVVSVVHLDALAFPVVAT